jgi:glycine/D-amino acid oxidase-like deaminating enzyme
MTTLAAGDIAFVRFVSDDPDNFAFVTLTAIDAGTTITFTDNAATSTAGTLASNEGSVTWTAAAAVAAGTVVNFTGANANGFGAVSGMSLSTSGENLFAF